MGELREIPDHKDRCTWHEGNIRCGAPAVAGSKERCVCADHLALIRKQNTAPGDGQ